MVKIQKQATWWSTSSFANKHPHFLHYFNLFPSLFLSNQVSKWKTHLLVAAPCWHCHHCFLCLFAPWTPEQTRKHILDSLCVCLKHFNPLTSSERQGFRHPSVQGLQPKQVTTDHSRNRSILRAATPKIKKGGRVSVNDIPLYVMKIWVDWTPDSDARAWHQQQGHLVLLQSSQYRFKQVRSCDSWAVVRNAWEHFPAAESAGLSKARFHKQKHLGAPADLLPRRKKSSVHLFSSVWGTKTSLVQLVFECPLYSWTCYCRKDNGWNFWDRSSSSKLFCQLLSPVGFHGDKQTVFSRAF